MKTAPLLLLLVACDLGYVPPCRVSDTVPIPIEHVSRLDIEGRSDGRIVVYSDGNRVWQLDESGAILRSDYFNVPPSNAARGTLSDDQYVTISQELISPTEGRFIFRAFVAPDPRIERALPLPEGAVMRGLRPISGGVALLWLNTSANELRLSRFSLDGELLASEGLGVAADDAGAFASAQDERYLVTPGELGVSVTSAADASLVKLFPWPAIAVAWRGDRIESVGVTSDSRVYVDALFLGSYVVPRALALSDRGLGLVVQDSTGAYLLVARDGKKLGADVPIAGTEGLLVSDGVLRATERGYRWVTSIQSALTRIDVVCEGGP